MKNDIPEQITIQLPNLHRSALKSLLNGTSPDYSFDDLVQLVLTKGIASLVQGRSLPGISDKIHQDATTRMPSGSGGLKAERVSADYVGFFVTANQNAALVELEDRFPLADEDEVLRILLDAGLRALAQDPTAQGRLDAVGSWPTEGGSP
jgi:hypothetical protein